jgi:Rho termination factor, N-terminal domain
MASRKTLSEKTVDELRALARAQDITGVSDMRKDELVSALADDPAAGQSSFAGWVRDRSLGIFFVTVFLLTWIGQLFFEWQTYVDEQREHNSTAVFWSSDFWEAFSQSTLENWQSEFLQLAAFTIAAAYFVFVGSSESPDSSERMEAKLDALLEGAGLDPKQVERQLPLKHQKTR